MNTLVTSDLKTTSRAIAAHFNKRHADMLRMIENFMSDADDQDFNQRNFSLCEGINDLANNPLPQRYKHYELTEEAALIIVGRMTGKHAAARQIALAQAFVAMKRMIKDQRLKADTDIRKQLEDTRATLQVYENLLESKANTLAKLLNIAPSKTRPYFQQLVDAGVLEQQEKVIHGFAYKPTTKGLDLVNHVDKNGIIHWKPEVLQLLTP